MKKIFLFILTIFTTVIVSAQTRIQITDKVSLVSYGNTIVIEDDENQRSISMRISQQQIDQKNGEATYEIVCGKYTKRVVKYGLKSAVAAGIAASSLTGSTSLMVSAAAEIATWIYDDVCDYYEKQYKKKDY